MDECWDAVILAGGAARRLGGADKPGVVVGGRPLLDHVLLAATGASTLVCVGPPRPTARPVLWCREDPPGAGPVAALATGVAHCDAPVVLVLGADLPSVGPAVPQLLAALEAGDTADVAHLVDPTGRVNHLAAAWRRPALTAALDRVADPAGAAMRAVSGQVRAVAVADAGGWGRDCDTWDDVEIARSQA